MVNEVNQTTFFNNYGGKPSKQKVNQTKSF